MPRLEETNFIDALVASGVPRENIEVVDFRDTAPSSLNIPAIKQDEVILRGISIAAVRDSDGETTALVIFRPTPATRKAVREYEGQDIALTINDEAGQFCPQRPQRITHTVQGDGNTIIVYTENQS